PEQRTLEQERIRNNARANLGQFFKLLNLPADQQEQYVDLQVDMEQRKANRISALLQENISVADALRDRDRDKLEQEERTRAVLGTNGYAFLNSIADDMRNKEAKRLSGVIQQNLGDNRLSPDQAERLQALLRRKSSACRSMTSIFSERPT